MTEDAIESGRAAWKRIREGAHWEDWTRVGRALEVGRSEAMREAHTNRPVGSGYNSAFSVWLDANGFGGMDKATRSRLFSCMDNLAEIERWRGAIGDKRLELNHPNAVWRAFVAATRVPKPRAPSPVEEMRARIVALEEENHALKKQIERLDHGGSTITRKDTVADIEEHAAACLLTRSRMLQHIARMRKRIKRMDERVGDRNGAAADPRQ